MMTRDLELCDSSPKERVFCCSVARETSYGFLAVKVVPVKLVISLAKEQA
ncbi:hypothetical protein [Clostridium chromiireducens]|nr:hypothetical protein [Clostridium chromiireducens]